MAGRPVPTYNVADYRDDIRILQGRGWTAERIARHLGMSRATYYRLLSQMKPRRR